MESKKSVPAPKGAREGDKTSDYYQTVNIPKKFENPSWFSGYGYQRPQHPFYKTTSFDYGKLPPTVHTVPSMYFPRKQNFSKKQGVGGNYTNSSLNTSLRDDY